MKRSHCPVSCALDVLGDRWTLIIVRDALFGGATTFGDFQSAPEKIASNILSARLQKMVDCGIFTKQKDPDNKLKIHYLLTDKGKDLKEVLMAVGRWGSDHISGALDMDKKIREVTRS